MQLSKFTSTVLPLVLKLETLLHDVLSPGEWNLEFGNYISCLYQYKLSTCFFKARPTVTLPYMK